MKVIIAAVALAVLSCAEGIGAEELALEKDELKFGFIKLTDCAPLVIAKEQFFFEDEGLFVTLEAQANWKVLLDRVIDGELDGAHMLAGQPIGATIGFGTQAHIITACSMDLNGNGITVANEVWQQMKLHVPKRADGEPWNQQAVFKGLGVPVTTNYDVWKNNPEKVFGVSKVWADKHPNTHKAVVKALIRAGKWLDEEGENGEPKIALKRRGSSPARSMSVPTLRSSPTA